MNQPRSIGAARTALAFVVAISMISMVLIANSPSASAQTTSVSQCNGTDNVGGQAVECHYTITNNIDGNDTSSTVEVEECHGAANDPPTMVCDNSTDTSTDLVTSVDQCNGSGNGGGGTVECTVDVVNNIVGTGTPSSASVNQCNSSGTGGGTEPTVLCTPFPANTSGAAVTQCNSSGNGGGGTQRVRCTVDSDSTTTQTLVVTVNQCNGSGNGGGATVTCRTGITSNVTQPPAGPSASPSSTPSSSPSGTPGPAPQHHPPRTGARHQALRRLPGREAVAVLGAGPSVTAPSVVRGPATGMAMGPRVPVVAARAVADSPAAPEGRAADRGVVARPVVRSTVPMTPSQQVRSSGSPWAARPPVVDQRAASRTPDSCCLASS